MDKCKLHNVNSSVDHATVKILASEFLVAMEIMTKHCKRSTFGDNLYFFVMQAFAVCKNQFASE